MWARRAILALAIVLALCWVNCSGTAGRSSAGASALPATGTGFLYVSDTVHSTISAFRVDNNAGTLTAVPGFPFHPAVTGPGRLAVDRSLHVLFVLNPAASSLTSYLIRQNDGSLTLGSTTPTELSPLMMALHPALDFIYVLNGSSIDGFSFNGNGIFTPLPGNPRTLTTGPGEWMTFDSTGQLLFVDTQQGIELFQVGSNGLLTPVTTPRVDAGTLPIQIIIDPAAAFIYSLDFGAGAGAQGRLFGWTFTGATGVNASFQPLPGTPIAAGVNPLSIVITPDGKFAYVGGGAADSGTIQEFTIGTNGQPTPVGSPVSSRPNPLQLLVDPSGRFLYAMDGNVPGGFSSVAENISVFLINSNTGVLTSVPGSPFGVTNPGGIAIVRIPP